MLCAVAAFALVGLAIAHATASAAGCQTSAGGQQYCPAPPPKPVKLTPAIEGTTNYLEGLQLRVDLAGDEPTGTLNMALFGPSDPKCTSPVYTATMGVSGNRTYFSWEGGTSGSYIASEPGVYRWTVDYQGDSKNGAASVKCGKIRADASKAGTSFYFSYWPFAGIGATATSTWYLYGPLARQGKTVVSLFGPGDTSCKTPLYKATFDATAGPGETVFSFDDPASAPILSETGSRVLGTKGTWLWTASYSGDSQNNASSVACGSASIWVDTYPSYLYLPSISSPINVGDSREVEVQLYGDGPAMTGQITFQLFADDPTCASTPVSTATVPVSGPGSYDTTWTADRGGDFRWVAKYSGDGVNLPSTTLCADFSPVTVWKANVTLTPDSNPPEVVEKQPLILGAGIADGFSPTGSVGFHLFKGPDCTGAETVKSTSFSGPGHVSSPAFTTLAPGVWSWGVTYTGDAANYEIPLWCQSGTITVTPAPPTLVGTPSPNVAHGGDTASDKVQVKNGTRPTGTLTFKLFANETCTGTPVATSTATVNGNGTYKSGGYKIPKADATTAPKTWQWTVSYSGDARNAPASLDCGSQPITVVKK